MNKRVLSMLIAILMLFTQYGTVLAIGVNEQGSSWAQNDINEWLLRGYIRNYEDGTFKPKQAITRAEFVEIVNKAFEIPDTKIEPGFIDIEKSQPYYEDIKKAKAAGYIDGYPDKTFRPHGYITREEAAKVIAVMLGLDEHYKDEISRFTDKETIGEWAKRYVNSLVALGAINGYPDGTFGSKNNISREEAVVILKRIHSNVTRFTGIDLTVTDGDKVLQNANVRLYTEDYKLVKELKTNFEGKAEFKDLKKGSYILISEGPTGLFGENVVVKEGFATLKVQRLQDSIEVTGSLEDQLGYKAPRGMVLVFEGKGTQILETLRSGEIKGNLLPDETYKVYLVRSNKLESLGKVRTGNEGTDIGVLEYNVDVSYDDYDDEPVVADNNPPQITFNTDDYEYLNDSENIFVVADKLGSIDGLITDKSQIKKLEYSITFGDLVLAANELIPAKNFKIDNPPLLVGLNKLTVKATDVYNNIGTSSIELFNISAENETGAELDQEDNDNDGLLNYQEVYFKTDPNNPDTDGDGLTDFDEIVITKTDPLKEDTDDNGVLDCDEDFDRDGLINIDELLNNADPYNEDTDFDGLNDNEELGLGTRLDEWDTDGDGLSDGDEIALGLNPLLQRTDGVTLDSERVFSQTLDEENISEALLRDNIAVPSLNFSGTGYLNGNTFIVSTEPSELAENRAIIGMPIEINSSTDFSQGAILEFEITDDFYFDNIETIVICQLTDDNEIEPLETYYDASFLSAEITEQGTYFLMDVDTFLLNLGIDVESYLEDDTFTNFSLDDFSYEAYDFDDFPDYVKESKLNSRFEDDEIDGTEIESDYELEEFEFEMDETTEEEIEFEEYEFDEIYDDFAVEASSDTMGQADIVFIIDATGSMGDEIRNVANNINTFARSLVYDYNINVNFGVIEYQDISWDGMDSTIIHKNGASNWFNGLAIDRFISTINGITPKDGGDYPETPIDALEMARLMTTSTTRQKFFVLVTDADYKVDNRYGIDSMGEMIERLNEDDINVTVITDWYEEPNYRSLYTQTGGLYGDIYSNFADVLDQIAQMIGTEVGQDTWIMLKGIYKPIRLDAKLEAGSNVDTDGDYLPDIWELPSITPVEEQLEPFIRISLRNYGISWETYAARGGKTSIFVYDYYSDPSVKDTDGDGYFDGADSAPRKWNVSDRDLAMCADMAYLDIPKGTRIDKDETWKEIINDHFRGAATAEELKGWTVYDTHYAIGLQCVAFKKDDNVVLAFRGSENHVWYEAIADWGVADILGFLTGFNAQVPAAKSFVNKIMKNEDLKKVYVSGHSLGGNLALNASSKAISIDEDRFTRLNTFNGLGLVFGVTLGIFEIGDELRLLSQEDKIIEYRVENDPVSNLWFTFHYGDIIEVDKHSRAKDAHDIYSIIRYLYLDR